MTRFPIHRHLLTAVLLAAVPVAANAGSFYIHENSVARLGNAFAGTASAAKNASTVYFNPAGMTRLDRPQIQIGLHYIRPVAEFDNDGSTTPIGTPIPGPDGKTDEGALVPNFYYVTPLNDIVTLGIGINSPFGLVSDYGEDWVGRYHATYSKLTTININPSLAFEISDSLSIGVGINYQHIEVTLERQIDSFAACVKARSAIPFPTTPCPVTTGLPGFGVRAGDSSVQITGDDHGFGINLGLLYEFDANTRIGVSWRQGIEYTLEGEIEFDPSAACRGSQCTLALRESDVSADVEFPNILTVSVTHGIGANWLLHADVAWYQWESMQKIEITRPNGRTVATLELDYENTLRYALGVSYLGFDGMTLRTGVAFDEAPNTDPENVSARIPDADRTWLTFGATFKLSRSASIDIAYAHIFVDDFRINNTNSQGYTLRGDYEAKVDTLSIAANWRF